MQEALNMFRYNKLEGYYKGYVEGIPAYVNPENHCWYGRNIFYEALLIFYEYAVLFIVWVTYTIMGRVIEEDTTYQFVIDVEDSDFFLNRHEQTLKHVGALLETYEDKTLEGYYNQYKLLREAYLDKALSTEESQRMQHLLNVLHNQLVNTCNKIEEAAARAIDVDELLDQIEKMNNDSR